MAVSTLARSPTPLHEAGLTTSADLLPSEIHQNHQLAEISNLVQRAIHGLVKDYGLKVEVLTSGSTQLSMDYRIKISLPACQHLSENYHLDLCNEKVKVFLNNIFAALPHAYGKFIISEIDLSYHYISGKAFLGNSARASATLYPELRQDLQVLDLSGTSISTAALFHISCEFRKLETLILRRCLKIKDFPGDQKKKSQSPAYDTIKTLDLTYSGITFKSPRNFFVSLHALFPNLEKFYYSASSNQTILGLKDHHQGTQTIAEAVIALPCGHIRAAKALKGKAKCGCSQTVRKTVPLYFRNCLLQRTASGWKNQILDYSRNPLGSKTVYYHSSCRKIFAESLFPKQCPACNEREIPEGNRPDLYPLNPLFFETEEDPMRGCDNLAAVGSFMEAQT